MNTDNLSSAIETIPVAIPLSEFGNADVNDVAVGKTFTSANGIKLTGTKKLFGESLDPVEVYNDTRPSDWITMPTPQDNELYLLVHIPKDASTLLAFKVTTANNGTYNVWLYKNNGEVLETKNSGIIYETELNADDFGSLTSTGMKQALVKITSEDSNAITGWSPSNHSKKSSPSNYVSWNILELSGRLPSLNSFSCRNLKSIKYCSLFGENNITSMSNMFSSCYSLALIPALDTKKVTSMSSMFYNCHSLMSIPALDTQNVTSMSNMFSSCYSLTSIPVLDTQNVTTMTGMFYGCFSLMSIPALDTQNVTSMSNMFDSCYSLTSIPDLDTQKVTNMSGMFSSCYSLALIPALDTKKVTNMNTMFYKCHSLMSIPVIDTQNVTNMSSMFDSSYSLALIPALDTQNVTNMSNTFNNCNNLTTFKLMSTIVWTGQDISFKNCSFTRKTIVELFQSLPTITSSKIITLTGNPGVSDLTNSDKAIATDKGWTLTL